VATAERAPAPALVPPAPHNLEAEESVLGAILLTDRALYPLAIEDGLRPEHFYREQHRIIYAAILQLYDRGDPIDVVTLKEHLSQTGRLEEAGGEAALHSLAGSVPAAAHVRHYAGIVQANALERALLAAGYEIAASVAERRASPRELVEQAERAILDIAHDGRRQEFRVISDVLDVELDKLHRLSKEKTALTGTPAGFKDLDELTGGFQPGNLVVIAARPGMGKSALVTNIAENAAIDHKRSVALFSLEMSETELAQRFLASQARIDGDKLRKGRVPENRWPKILEASQRLSQARLFVDDTSDLGILEIRAKARRLQSREPEGLGLIIVDYLQLMRAEGRTDNRAEQVGQMSRGLKILARELNVPVIALSQLNRNVEQRGGDKRPLLSDLRESGSVEQDADLVIFIYRDEYYAKEESEHQGEAELIIAKHRNGPLGKLVLTFRSEYPKFMNFIDPGKFES
jgi:replicative DNA helicase